jgi:glycosyltransferase involved in cell wall biosynthesis
MSRRIRDHPAVDSLRAVARKLTVVIPTRNRAACLGVAIASVLASPLINDPRQVVVVDDDSTDNTSVVAREFDTEYIRVRCHGPSGTRNAGLMVSTTPYITFLDDDDAWVSGAMERQLEALDHEPDAAFAYGVSQAATEAMQPLDVTWPAAPLPSGRVPEQLYLALPQIGAVMFRRDLLVESGGFDSKITFGEDAELMLRLAAHHAIVGVDAVSVLYRQRAPSRARADYYWKGRSIVHWRPGRVGVGWRAFVRFESHTRGLFASRFCEDAAWCAEHGSRRDALVCLSRALRISPPHTLVRLHPMFWPTLRKVMAVSWARPPTTA